MCKTVRLCAGDVAIAMIRIRHESLSRIITSVWVDVVGEMSARLTSAGADVTTYATDICGITVVVVCVSVSRASGSSASDTFAAPA